MKKKTLTIAIAITILLASAGVLLWQRQRIVEKEKPLFQEEVISTANWQTFRDDKLGIEFRYPPDWDLRQKLTIFTATAPAATDSAAEKIKLGAVDAERIDAWLPRKFPEAPASTRSISFINNRGVRITFQYSYQYDAIRDNKIYDLIFASLKLF